MFTAYVVVTVAAAATNTYAAYVDFIHAEWVVVVTVVRAHWYSHIRYPAPLLVLAGGSLALLLSSS
jgi:hypothetical protein